MSEHLPCGYEEIERELVSAGSDMNAAEMHGLMTGWLCQHNENDESWPKKLFPEIQVTAMIKDVFAAIAEQLASDEFVFELLLPEEEASLGERGAAVADWCSAFMSGIGMAEVKKEYSKDLEEGFHDLIEVTKLDYSELEDSEENEVALTEISEFVKTVVMMTYWEVREKLSKDALH
jgi:uncharacterized protein YgfB (UPF0149 family)